MRRHAMVAVVVAVGGALGSDSENVALAQAPADVAPSASGDVAPAHEAIPSSEPPTVSGDARSVADSPPALADGDEVARATRILREPAPSKPTHEQLARARTSFVAGARAYDRGDYRGAIQAMEAAYSHAARPGILYSIGQAYRHLYLVKRGSKTAAIAAAFYRAYVERDPAGRHAAEAFSHLAALQAVVDRAQAERRARLLLETERQAPVSRLLITTSVDGARLRLDGRAVGELPAIAEVAPGRHRIHVVQRGYFAYEREVHVPEGAVVNLDVPLRPRPVSVSVHTKQRAPIYVDGEAVGETPLQHPLLLLPGNHVIELRTNGHLPSRHTIVVRAAESAAIAPVLELTTQRKFAWGAIGGAGVAAMFATGFTVLSASNEQQARNWVQRATQEGNVEPRFYESAVNHRDLYRGLAIGTWATAVVLAVTGTALYAFDEPVANDSPGPSKRDPGRPRSDFELSGQPLLGPDVTGASIQGRF